MASLREGFVDEVGGTSSSTVEVPVGNTVGGVVVRRGGFAYKE